MIQDAGKLNECGKKFQCNFFLWKTILSGKTENEFGFQQKFIYTMEKSFQYFLTKIRFKNKLNTNT